MTSIRPPEGMPYRVPETVEQRQAIERKIVSQAIRDLTNAGYEVVVNDGEDDVTEPTMDYSTIFNAMFSTDMDYLKVYAPGIRICNGWVFFVYGNDGPDVINDYTTNLEGVLAATIELADQEERKLND